MITGLKTIVFTCTAALLLTVTTTFAGEGGESAQYMGSVHCKMCHKEWFESWVDTPMAKAFKLLRPGNRYKQKIEKGLDPDKDYTEDESCLPCHTVGYNQPGGYSKEMPLMVAKKKGFLGVGCEMCHGAGEHYWQLMPKFKLGQSTETELIAAGLVLPGRTDKGETCNEVCHNSKNPFHRTLNFEEAVVQVSTRGKRTIHEHFELKALEHFGGDHDVALKSNVRYTVKSRVGVSDEFLQQFLKK